MLKNLGHDVYGIGLNPPKNGMFELASVKTVCSTDVRLDIRNKEALDAEVDRVQPEIVLHLAAQALVLTSYEQIYETYSTNVVGTKCLRLLFKK
jgi:CDP-glucose 4,6-dehydratase